MLQIDNLCNSLKGYNALARKPSLGSKSNNSRGFLLFSANLANFVAMPLVIYDKIAKMIEGLSFSRTKSF